MRNPFTHKHDEASHEPAAAEHAHGGWLKRESDGIAHGSSSLFVHSHEDHLAPTRTCIQGHDIPPGQETCSHGHPVG